MVTAIKQRVVVQADGVIEVRSSDLCAGQQADVIVLIETPEPPPADPGPASSLARLQRFAGVIDSGDPRSGDNERIDADLAKAYGAANDPAT